MWEKKTVLLTGIFFFSLNLLQSSFSSMLSKVFSESIIKIWEYVVKI